MAMTEPRWLTLDDMNADELAAYDYGCEGAMNAIERLLDGRDKGEGVSQERWQAIRQAILDLKAQAKAKLMWESTTPVYTPLITNEKYEKLWPFAQKYYRPVRVYIKENT